MRLFSSIVGAVLLLSVCTVSATGSEGCCEALTAECVACAEGVTVEQLCVDRPTLAGCVTQQGSWWSQYRYYLVAGYVLLLALLIVIQQRVRASQGSVLRSFNREVDKLWHDYSLAIYQHRDEIHDYEESVDLLYATRKSILESDSKNYVDHFDSIREDMKYLESLINEDIVEDATLNELSQTHGFLRQSDRLYTGLGWVITLLTGGLYKLWEPVSWK